MSVSADDARRIAKLARLRLSEEELKLYGAQLSKILEAMEELGRLDVSGVAPMISAPAGAAPMRDDEAKPFDGRERILSGAPERDGPYFKVRKVIE